MAGVYRGREAIFRFLGRLPKETGGTYGSRLDRRARERGARRGALSRLGERRGRRLDLDQVLLFRLENGLVARCSRSRPIPATFDEFWALT